MPTKIEWTDETWNPIRARHRKTLKSGHHCEHVTEACRFCYAERMNRWRGTGLAFKPGHRADIEIYLDRKTLYQPLAWREGRKIFVCSMTDLFADFVTKQMLDRIFAVMALTPRHTFQILTKRPARMRDYLRDFNWRRAVDNCRTSETDTVPFIYRHSFDSLERLFGLKPQFSGQPDRSAFPPPNVMGGTSVHDQPSADEFVPPLLEAKLAWKFLSIEPMLGPIDFKKVPGFNRIDLNLRQWWIIAGGESGPQARPSHPDWFRQIRDQCAAARVPFFFKQWGEWAPQVGAVDGWNDVSDNPEISRFDHRDWEGDHWGAPYRPMWCDEIEDDTVSRIGKKAAGAKLDGKEHREFPA